MGFYKDISDSYGPRTTRLLKDYSRFNQQLTLLYNHRIFLLRCRQNDIRPPRLQRGLQGIELFSYNLLHKQAQLHDKFSRILLNMQIRDIHDKLSYVKRALITTYCKVKESLPCDIYEKFFELQTNKYNKQFNKVKLRQQKKFNVLVDKQRTRNFKTTQDNWFLNLSNTHVPNDIKETLALGPHHSLPITKENFPTIDLCCAIEQAAQKLDDDNRTNFRNTALSKLCIHKQTLAIPRNIILDYKAISNAKQFLKQNNNFLALRADKGNVTVGMDKDSYIDSITSLLNDTNTYMQVRFEYTATFEKTNNTMIGTWVKKKYITKQKGGSLTTHFARTPRAYGLPKVHKPQLGWRLIVDSTGGPTYSLARFLSDILKNVVGKTQHYVKDSWSFVEELKEFRIPNNYILISLDVISLFTNIPTDLVITTCEEKWDEIKLHTKKDSQKRIHKSY